MLLSDQEIFTKVKNHLLTQNCKSYNPNIKARDGNSQCLYRGPNGTKCALGCLINDAYYSPDFEQNNISEFREAMLASGIYIGATDCSTYRLLHELQCLHDFKYVENWPMHLELIAKEFDLVY